MPDPDPFSRTSRKRTQTRDRIAAVSFELFERLGFDAVTMEQIAGAAGVVRATLYNHFPIKEAVLAHGLHEQLARDLRLLGPGIRSRPTFTSRLASLLEPSARWWEAHRQYAAPYIRYRFQQVGDARAGQPSSDMITAYAQLIAQAQEAGELRANEPALRLAHYLHFLGLCALMTWIGDAQVSLADEFSRATAFFIAGAARP
jgi:AcrR family transcriptional regulator